MNKQEQIALLDKTEQHIMSIVEQVITVNSDPMLYEQFYSAGLPLKTIEKNPEIFTHVIKEQRFIKLLGLWESIVSRQNVKKKVVDFVYKPLTKKTYPEKWKSKDA